MIIGHQKQWNFLKKAAETASFSHAYLFSGPEKLGKRTLALEWISLLFKQDIKNHPDFVLVEPQAKEIKISQIKDLIWRLSFKSGSAGMKAAIIDNAHLMNQEAQTCILKTLEEPKGNALLILITDKIQELFPTIVSRAQTIKFYPVDNKEIKNYLKKQQVSERDQEEICRVSVGRPGIALDFVSDPQRMNIFHDKIKEVEKISKTDLAFRFRYAKELSEDVQKTRETLDAWTLYFREKLIKAVSNQQSTIKLREILNFLQKTNSLMSGTNVNPRLALEMLMLEL
jgi:DNA polymerase-3 subunit delta'